MMRVICLLLVSLFALKVNAQQYTKFNGYGFQADRIKSDSISIHPSDTIRNKAARSIAVLNGVFYIADGTKWKVVGTDTTALSNRINLKLNIADTINKWVTNVYKVNDSTIAVLKNGTISNIVLNPAATKLVTSVYNKSGALIPKGSVVYIDGAHSSVLPSIALAKANKEESSAYTYGLVETDISNNAQGIVIQSGVITNLNLPTSSYTDGQTLYLSPTVAGGFTTTKPLAPNHYVAIGTIIRAHPNFGTIQIAIRNGFQLDEMSDVSIALVPLDSTILQFSRVDSLWHDVNPTTAMGNRFIKPTDTATMLTPYSRGSGTSGQVAYWNATRSLTGSSNLFWDNANGRLGIGTASPSQDLTVSRTIDGVASISLLNGSAGTTASSRFYISNTSTQLGKLGSNYTTGSILKSGDLFMYNQTVGNITFWNNLSTGNINFTTGSASTAQLTLASTGNLLLNTSSDAGYKLDVNGTARVQFGATEVGLQMTHSNGNTASIVIGNGSSATTGNVEFWRNGEYVTQYTGSSVLFRYANLRARNNTSLTLTGGIGYGATIGTSIRLAANTSDGGGYTATSGTQSTVLMGNGSNEIWQPSSGTATYNLFSVLPVINTSGTYSGIVRGMFYNPTLTSITGVTHRAIETTTGDVILGSTSGSVGIGANTTINASAIVDVTSTTKGFLPPRMTTAQRDLISTPAAGLIIYNTSTNKHQGYNGSTWNDFY